MSEEELKATLSVSMRTNLGNYESAEAFMSVSNITKDTTPEEVSELLDGSEVSYELMKKRLHQRVIDLKEGGGDAPVSGETGPNRERASSTPSGEWWLVTHNISDFQADYKRDPSEAEKTRMHEHRNKMGKNRVSEALARAVVAKTIPEGSLSKTAEAALLRKGIYEESLDRKFPRGMRDLYDLDTADFDKVVAYVEGITENA